GDGEGLRDVSTSSDIAVGDDADRNEVTARLESLSGELKQAETALAAHPLPLVYAGVRKQPEPTIVFERGDIRKPGQIVAPAAIAAARSPPPEFGLPVDAPEAERRLKFAEWVASR